MGYKQDTIVPPIITNSIESRNFQLIQESANINKPFFDQPLLTNDLTAVVEVITETLT